MKIGISTQGVARGTEVRPLGRTPAWWKRFFRLTITYLFLTATSILFLIPFAWMISTSLKPQDQIFVYPIQWVPHPFIWGNYEQVFEQVPFFRYILNTMLITGVGVIGSLTGSSIAAYSFARMRFPGKNFLFLVMLSTVMVPGWVTLIPSYIGFHLLGWLDTYKPILVPAFFASPVNTFLLRQFFLTISPELEDAARIDGCSTFRVFWNIILPLSKPAMIIIAIFAFFYYWNDFLGPLIYLQTQDKFPLSLGVASFVSEMSSNYALTMAAASMALMPCILLFFLAQRWFVQGVVITGVKG